MFSQTPDDVLADVTDLLEEKEFAADVIDSFIGAAPNPPGTLKPSDDIRIWLESTDDTPAFVERYRGSCANSTPAAATRLHKAPSMQNTSPLERDHYLQAAELDWDARRKQELLERVVRSGRKIAGSARSDNASRLLSWTKLGSCYG